MDWRKFIDNIDKPVLDDDQSPPMALKRQFVSAPKRRHRAEIKIQTWAEFRSENPEERKWTVDGILPDKGLAVLGGRGKQGKSTLAIHLCRAIASGTEFLGRASTQKTTIY